VLLIRRLGIIALLLVVAASGVRAPVARAAAAGSAFTYQGALQSNNTLTTGSYDFVFTLCSDSTAVSTVGTPQTLLGVPVTNGLFTVRLDFGSGAFDGNARWLDIQVRVAGGGGYTTLAPRQLVTASPYAVRSFNGGGGSSQWSNDANGIDYSNNVAIGAATHPDWKFYVDTGTNPINAGVFKGNNASYATLFVENDATGGYGFYSAANTDDYVAGRMAVNIAPVAWTRLDVGNLGSGIWSQVTGSILNPNYNAAVVALGNTGGGAFGTTSMGAYCASVDDRGVWGLSANNLGVVGDNQAHQNSGWLGGLTEGVFGQATQNTSYGGRFTNTATGGVALRVDGIGQVKTLQILGGADLAERFEVPEGTEPGTVMAIDPDRPGRLVVAREAYSREVAGVVSGANGLHAGVELGPDETQDGSAPIALTGRVWVRCDASRHAIHAGDLLTTSGRAGYAMVAADSHRAAGAILGKAMTSLETGTGYVLVLVSLQ
jgi:hypothetical protein